MIAIMMGMLFDEYDDSDGDDVDGDIDDDDNDV